MCRIHYANVCLSFFRNLFPFEGILPITPWSSAAHEGGSPFDQKLPLVHLKIRGSWYPKSGHAPNEDLEAEPPPHQIAYQAIIETWWRDCSFYAGLSYCNTWTLPFFLGSFLLRWGPPFWCYPSWLDSAEELCSLETVICYHVYMI